MPSAARASASAASARAASSAARAADPATSCRRSPGWNWPASVDSAARASSILGAELHAAVRRRVDARGQLLEPLRQRGEQLVRGLEIVLDAGELAVGSDVASVGRQPLHLGQTRAGTLASGATSLVGVNPRSRAVRSAARTRSTAAGTAATRTGIDSGSRSAAASSSRSWASAGSNALALPAKVLPRGDDLGERGVVGVGEHLVAGDHEVEALRGERTRTCEQAGDVGELLVGLLGVEPGPDQLDVAVERLGERRRAAAPPGRCLPRLPRTAWPARPARARGLVERGSSGTRRTRAAPATTTAAEHVLPWPEAGGSRGRSRPRPRPGRRSARGR